MREEPSADQPAGGAGQRLARLLAEPAAAASPAAAVADVRDRAPAISLRQSGGDWRPYRRDFGGLPGSPADPGGGAGPDRNRSRHLLDRVEADRAEAGRAVAGRAHADPDRDDSEPGRAPAAAGLGAAAGLARLAGDAFDPGRRGLRALVVIAVVVVLGAGALAWWSRPQPEPVVPQLASTAAASPASPALLVVAVTGLVHEPGLVELPAGARVADAIEAAGGLLPEAELDHLNLARKLVDGELIAVGIDPPPAAEAGAPADGAAGGKVNLNTATSEELQALPGIGPALAQRIIDHRTEQGPFTSVGQLRQVSGIGEVRFAELQDLVTV